MSLREIQLPPRDCPGCGEPHPPLTTCAGGGRPWDGSPVVIAHSVKVAAGDLWATEEEWAHAGSWAAEVVRIDTEAGARPYFVPVGESMVDATQRGHVAEHVAGRAVGLAPDCRVLSMRELRRGPKRPDLGSRTQVRNARNPLGALRVYKPDPEGHLALLIVGRRRGPYRIAGWLEIAAARRIGSWIEDPGNPSGSSWHIGQEQLRPLPLPADA